MGRLWGGIDDDEIAEALQQIFDEAADPDRIR